MRPVAGGVKDWRKARRDNVATKKNEEINGLRKKSLLLAEQRRGKRRNDRKLDLKSEAKEKNWFRGTVQKTAVPCGFCDRTAGASRKKSEFMAVDFPISRRKHERKIRRFRG